MTARGTRHRLIILILLPLLVTFSSAGDPAVFITRTGERYHVDGCRYLAQSKIPISLEEALSRGYTACGVCKPALRSPEGAGTEETRGNTGTSPSLSPPPASLRRDETPAQTGLYQVNTENLKSTRDAELSRMSRVTVTGHVDGDTVKVTVENPVGGLQRNETIRMLGVDTPETVHPSRPVEHFGREASEYTKKALLGKTVYLAFDWDQRDRYGRLLAYIYLPDGSCHNANLIAGGYANAYVQFSFQFLEEFRELERIARIQERGLWKKD